MGPNCWSSRDSTQVDVVGEFDSGVAPRMGTCSSVSSSRALTGDFGEWKMFFNE